MNRGTDTDRDSPFDIVECDILTATPTHTVVKLQIQSSKNLKGNMEMAITFIILV